MHTHSTIGSTAPHPKQSTKQPLLAPESHIAELAELHRMLQKCLAQRHAPVPCTKDKQARERAKDAGFVGSALAQSSALCGISTETDAQVG